MAGACVHVYACSPVDTYYRGTTTALVSDRKALAGFMSVCHDNITVVQDAITKLDIVAETKQRLSSQGAVVQARVNKSREEGSWPTFILM